MKFSLFFIFAFFLVAVLAIPASLAQDVVPSWIKNNADWWADDKIDYEEKSIFFETIKNEGTVTFSGEIKSVLADGQNYSNFNENTLNTLEGKHNYKVTLMTYNILN